MDKGAVLVQEGIEEARLAHIGAPNDGTLDPLPPQSPFLIGLQPLIDGVKGLIQLIFKDFSINGAYIFLLDKIDISFKGNTDLKEPIPQDLNMLREGPGELALGYFKGLFILPHDQVGDGLGLNEVDLSIDKGPLCKFPGEGQSCPLSHEGPKDLFQEEGPSMGMDLDNILPRIGLGGLHPTGHDMV